MRKIYLSSLMAVSLFLNSSCYFMNTVSDSTRVLDTKITHKNERVLGYEPVVKLTSFDISSKQLTFNIQRYPSIGFDEYRQSVHGKGNLGGTVLNGTMGYAIIAGLMLAGAFLPSTSAGKGLSDSTKQGLLYGAAGTGGVAVLDLLISLLYYIPSTKDVTTPMVEEKPQSIEPVRNTVMQIKSSTPTVLYSGSTDTFGNFIVPIKTVLTDLSQGGISFGDSTGQYQSSLFSLKKIKESAELAAVNELNRFEAEQVRYLEVLELSKKGDFENAISVSIQLDRDLLLQEQVEELGKKRQEWYRVRYEQLVKLASEASPDNADPLITAIEQAKGITSDSPYYRDLQKTISDWIQKSYQLKLQKSYQLAGAKKFLEAFELASTIPEAFKNYEVMKKKISEWRNLYYQQMYQEAYAFATTKQFEAAYILAGQIPETAPIYPQAHKKSIEWEALYWHEIFLRAYREANQGNFASALELLVLIPNRAKDYKQAQTKLVQWKKILEEKERLASKAQEEEDRQKREATLKKKRSVGTALCATWSGTYTGYDAWYNWKAYNRTTWTSKVIAHVEQSGEENVKVKIASIQRTDSSSKYDPVINGQVLYSGLEIWIDPYSWQIC